MYLNFGFYHKGGIYMKHRGAIYSLVLAVLIILITSVSALAIPQLINYQGELTDSSGNPITNSVSITFTIYNAATAGDVLWTETQTVTVTDGVFNVLLGSQTPIPADTFDGDERYLGVQVGADPEMAPRQVLASVPFCFRAATLSCIPGDSLNCYSGDPATKGVGLCVGGTRTCGTDGVFGACEGEVTPITEVCGDGLDNNCDGQVDEDCVVDGDGDSYDETVDCDDADPDVHPGATEVCDNVDNNCSNGTDEGCDDDADAYCDAGMVVIGTPAVCPFGGGDCNDNNNSVSPGATEICDNVDNNCSNGTDEGCDDDGDAYCDDSMVTIGTPAVCPYGGGDCDDSPLGDAINPSALEICDGIDNDCNEGIDEGCSSIHYIFATSYEFAGDLGGLTGADASCETAAASGAATSGLSATWFAILSDSSTDVNTRVSIQGPVYNINDDLVANDSSDLWDGTLANAVSYDENGVIITAGDGLSVWTGSDSSGYSIPSSHCLDWSNSTAGSMGSIGLLDTTDQWINGSTVDSCDNQRHIYCISSAITQ
jgi:hypothetical protein